MNEICNESTTLVPLELGFIQKTDPWMLTSHSFPSKIGGRPAWLSLGTLPRDLSCEECGKQLCFLLQVYAPIEGKPSCFHRTILLFICRNGSCYQEGKKPTMRAFRSQLPHDNMYYFRDTVDVMTMDDIKRHGNIKHAESIPKLCAICGCDGTLQCGKCEKVFYCCKEHKVYDLDERHASECDDILTGEKEWCPILNWAHNSFIFPEFELVMGPDPHHDDESSEKNSSEGSLDESQSKFEPMSVDSVNQLESVINVADNCSVEKKKMDDRYQRSILREPNQVLRYHRAGEPLWICEKNRLESPPVCGRCGAARQFEFQVLPQLLSRLNLELLGNSMDWGSLFIFTCSNSCDTTEKDDVNDDTHIDYVEEYVWKQDIVQ